MFVFQNLIYQILINNFTFYVTSYTIRNVPKSNLGKGGYKMTVCEKEITNAQLVELLEDDEASFMLLDVRETTEYALQHIPGSVLIPLEQLADRIEELSKEDTIYVICHSGERSLQACCLLNDNGFDNLFHVVPGLKDWDGIVTSDII